MRLDERLANQTTEDGRIDFHDHISSVREEASSWLEGNEKNGVEHSRRLENYLDRLIPDEFKEKLKPAEVFILLYAVYLHDIGYRKDDGSIESKDHPKRSKERILKEPATYLFGNFPSRGSASPSAAKAVATVCYGHAPESICPLDSISDKFTDQYLCSETLNLRLLAALLRLADEMDQPYMRLGHFRKHISLVEIGTDIVRWYWEDLGKDAGADLEKQIQKTKEALRETNNYLYPWGLPPRTIVLEPSPLDVVSPPKEPIDYKKFIPKHYIPSRCHDEKGDNKGLLHDYVLEWLNDRNRELLAVLGDYGIGKTSFCYKFACDITGSAYVPVVVELKTVMTKGWGDIPREIRSRAGDSTQSPVLILDGFDELSLTFDDETVFKEIENLGTVPYIVISGIDICGFGSPTVEKKSIPPKSSKLISARCMALVPLLMPLVLMSKFSYNAIPAKSDWHRCGFEKNLAERLKGLKIPFLLSKALVVVGVPRST